MPRFRFITLLWLLAPLTVGTAHAQPSTPVVAVDADRPQTGDAWIDQHLADINVYAARYPGSFLDDLVRYAGARRGYVQALLQQHGWKPGDVYFACHWAFATHQSCRELVRRKSRAPDGTWEGVIDGLPIAADVLHYRMLRHAIVASYDRWDRPITLDALLQRQLGDRPQRMRRLRDAAEAAQAADDARL